MRSSEQTGFSFFKMFFISQQPRKVYLDPLECRRKLHAVGPCVQAGGEIDDHIHTSAHGFENIAIDQVSSDHDDPGVSCGFRQGIGDLLAALSRQPLGEIVLEQRVTAFALAGAVDCRPKRGI